METIERGVKELFNRLKQMKWPKLSKQNKEEVEENETNVVTNEPFIAPITLAHQKKKQLIIEMQGNMLMVWSMAQADVAKGTFHTIPLSSDILKEGYVQDEFAFTEQLAALVKERKWRNYEVSTFVPDKSVLYRIIEYPEDVIEETLYDYVSLELNQTIHLPFDDSYFDVQPKVGSDHEAILFATPSDTAMNMLMPFEDAKLKPAVLDIRALSILRTLRYLNIIRRRKTYLIAEWQPNAVIITIYSDRGIEFLRYHSIDYDEALVKVTYNGEKQQYEVEGEVAAYEGALLDPIFEIQQILGFYEFSIHKGATRVEEFVVIGTNPLLSFIVERMKDAMQLPIQLLTDEQMESIHPQFKKEHVALAGMLMRGEQL